jgi:hypothetical protein
MKRLLLLVVALALTPAPLRAVDADAIDKAVERGVASLRKMQRADGTWPHTKIGATALAGLALLECGATADDKAVHAAAEKVRQAGLAGLSDTYSLALSVLFLDRLDVRTDTPLIESMILRLLAGQSGRGHWAYECVGINALEARRIKAEMEGRELVGSRDLSLLPAKGKRKPKDLPKAIQAQLQQVGRALPNAVAAGDNSNTQFALMALWVGRRYGVPTQLALKRVEQHFRTSQNNDGSWGYATVSGPGPAPVIMQAPGMGRTASMTCAGLLGLAVGHGASLDVRRAKDPKAEPVDVTRDRNVKAGLQALATAIGKPTGWAGVGRPDVNVQFASGKAYYYLWSLERVGVAYNLNTIGGKDWYRWGAEVLLRSQNVDGGWVGEYGAYGCDTSFALLFLKKANLARDLSAGLSSKGLDTVLRSGGVGGAGLKGSKSLAPSDIGAKPRGPEASKPADRPNPAAEKTPAGRLAGELLRSGEARRAALLKKLRDSKGAEYTDALVEAIGRLEGDARRQAREALADRLTRMKPTTLREYLKDEEAEIRRAAALAVGQQDSKTLTPDLIRLLDDPQTLVQRAAYAALKAMSGKDFGPAAGADRAARAKAVAAWTRWWKKQARE